MNRISFSLQVGEPCHWHTNQQIQERFQGFQALQSLKDHSSKLFFSVLFELVLVS
jgi:hypothetical protein